MADIIHIEDVARARRRAHERDINERCIEILQVNLTLTLHQFSTGDEAERPVRARQLRQLGELLEYVVART